MVVVDTITDEVVYSILGQYMSLDDALDLMAPETWREEVADHEYFTDECGADWYYDDLDVSDEECDVSWDEDEDDCSQYHERTKCSTWGDTDLMGDRE